MKKLYFTFLCLLSLVSCDDNILISNENYVNTKDNQTPLVETLSDVDATFVSENQAIDVANKFWSEINGATRSNINNHDYDLDIVYSEDQPQMYVLNYKEGGFIIVSATKDYYPILAYSEDGTFPVGQEEGGLKIWMEETESAIADYAQEKDSIKTAFRMMWSQFETHDPSSFVASTRSNAPSGEMACLARLEYYYRLSAGSGGWNFAPLSQAASAFSGLGLSAEYESLCFRAQANNSALNETVVGWRIVRGGDGIFGPYIQTAWHQHPPFSNMFAFNVGCGAVAVSQLMNYYKYPETFTVDGTTYNWNNIPNYPSSSSDQAALLKYVYLTINSFHFPKTNWTFTFPNDLMSGLRTMGYSVTEQDHNYSSVMSILKSGSPVIMLGNAVDLPDIYPIGYVDGGHYWICDGVNDVTYYLEFFAEWQPYGNGTFDSGWYSYESPNSIQSNYVNRSFHMNWGWQENSSTHYNGWFIGDSTDSGNGDFRYNRKDYIISVGN